MSNVGFGDIFFILLILGVIHGIMTWVQRLRDKAKESAAGPADQQPGS